MAQQQGLQWMQEAVSVLPEAVLGASDRQKLLGVAQIVAMAGPEASNSGCFSAAPVSLPQPLGRSAVCMPVFCSLYRIHTVLRQHVWHGCVAPSYTMHSLFRFASRRLLADVVSS